MEIHLLRSNFAITVAEKYKTVIRNARPVERIRWITNSAMSV